MTNAKAIAQALQQIKDDDVAESVADYINCPSVIGCEFDGKDNSPCTECKIKWLRSKWED